MCAFHPLRFISGWFMRYLLPICALSFFLFSASPAFAATITRSIGPSGCDYISINNAEANIVNDTALTSKDLVSQLINVVYELYGEWDANGGETISGWTCNDVYKLKIQAGSGRPKIHDDTAIATVYKTLQISSSYIVVSGLHLISNTSGTTNDGDWALFINNVDNVTVENCILDTTSAASGQNYASNLWGSNLIIDNCTITGTDGIYDTNAGKSNITISNCVFEDITGSYILQKSSGADITVRDCIFRNCADDFCIFLGACDNFKLYNNIINASTITQYSIYYSTTIATHTQGYIVNNTIYGVQAGKYGISLSSVTHGNTQVRNNIIYLASNGLGLYYSGSTSTYVTSDNNCVYDSAGNGYFGWDTDLRNTKADWYAATGMDFCSIEDNPNFLSTDSASPDWLHIDANSPCIGGGTDLSGLFSTDIDGDTRPAGAWCIGADEVPPTIGYVPTSFTFNAVEGGSNPASQILSIWNSGGGMLNWNVTDDQSWITLNPPEGSSTGDNDSVTVWANSTSLTAGTYNGQITITAGGATNSPQTVPVTLTVNPPPPVADFVATPLSGQAPLVVDFADGSSGSIDTWAWDFEDDGTTDSFEQNTSHSYNIPGMYTVKLTVTGPGGPDSETKSGYITVLPPPPSITFLSCWDSPSKGVSYGNDTWHMSPGAYFEFGNDSQCDGFKFYWGTGSIGTPNNFLTYNPAIPGSSANRTATIQTTWYFRVRAYRGAENGPIASFIFKYDAGPPTSMILFPQDASYVSSVPNMYGNAADYKSGVNKVSLCLRRNLDPIRYYSHVQSDFTELSETWFDAAYSPPNWTYAIGAVFADGLNYTLRARPEDAAGNIGPVEVSTFTYDSTSPMAPDPCYCADRINPPDITGVTAPGFIGYNLTEQIGHSHIQVGDGADLDGDILILWDSGWLSTPTPGGQNTSEIGYAGSSLAYSTSYYWRMRFKDLAGNPSSWSATQQFQLLPPPNIYVSNSGDNANDGLTWATAVKTIQKGIDLAVDGVTTVWVADGTYTGPNNIQLYFGGKAITLKSTGGALACIIDCALNGRAFDFIDGEWHDTVIDGFTIVNGDEYDGGGIRCADSSPTIRRCIIKDCYADEGAGVHCTNNSLEGPIIENCLIINNEASFDGGGIYCDSVVLIVHNSVIANNFGDYGGCICVHDSSDIQFYCTIIWNNDAMYEGYQIYTYSSNSYVECYASLYEDGGLFDISGSGNFWSDDDCFDIEDPLFIDDANYDFHLQAGSPCIDAGCNSYIPAEIITDLDGNLRIMGGTVDMGCYEATPPPGTPSDLLTSDRTNPGSLGCSSIYFSAIHYGEGPGSNADAAWIQVDDDPAFTTPLWNSNWISLDPSVAPPARCQDIPYVGPALSPAITYYWRIKFDNKNDQEGPFSDITASFALAGYTQSLPWKGYHLLNIPCYMPGMTVGEIIGDDLDLIWIFRYDEANREWIQVTASEEFDNNVGYFAWCTETEPGKIIGFNGETVGPDGNPRDISLTCSDEADLGNYGWNLIRNPFSLSVEWPDCILQNCLMTKYCPWNGTEYLMDHQVDGGCGSHTIPAGASFWVHANGSDAKITFPNPFSAPRPLPPPMLHWKVQLTAKSGTLLDTQTFIGAREGALITYDQYDIMKIRSYATDYMRAFFDHPEWGRYSGPYAMDVRPFPAAGGTLTWNMKVYATNANGQVSLSWVVPPELHGGWRFYIQDKTDGVMRNMTLFNSYDYPASGEDTREFTLTATMLEVLLLGDSNLDGTVDEADAVVCLRAEHGLDTLSPQQRYLSDMNSDGKVSVLDALLILKHLRGHLGRN